MPLFQMHLPLSSFPPTVRRHTVLALALVIAVGLAASPQTSRAQIEVADINFCTILQESPQTAGARSAISDDWNVDNGSWESQTRIIQTFSGDNLVELLIQERDSLSGAWRDTARATPEYDASNRVELCTVETKQDNEFVNTLRFDPEYNSSGRLDVRLVEVWDSTDANPNGEWVNFLRTTFEYDNSGNDTLEVSEFWEPSSGTWLNAQRIHRMYDAQDRIELARQETWNLFNSSWENELRTQHTYESSSTVEVVETWDGSSWMNEARTTTMLNNNDLPTGSLTEDWDGSDWVNDEQSTNTYTTFEGTEKFEQIVFEDWETGSNSWVNESRSRFSYDSIIPVELARFAAQRSGRDGVRLTWQTASETNNSGFEVQRQTSASPSGSWNTVQFVEGAGTTSEPQSYRFTDRSVPYEAEAVRYRLRQVDLDGSAELSSTVEVRIGSPARLALRAPFPNPAQGQATVRYELPEATDVQIAVYDLLGRRVATPVEGQKNAGRSQFRLRTQQLPSGTYILRLQAAEQTRTQRLTIVK